MKTIYTLEYSFYSDNHVRQFPDTEEGIKELWEAVDSHATSNGGPGWGDSFLICRYEIEDQEVALVDQTTNNTGKRRPQGGEYYSSNEALMYIDEDGDEMPLDPIAYVSIGYVGESAVCQIEAGEDSGKWTDEDGNVYDTEDEAWDNNNPSSFYDLP